MFLILVADHGAFLENIRSLSRRCFGIGYSAICEELAIETEIRTDIALLRFRYFHTASNNNLDLRRSRRELYTESNHAPRLLRRRSGGCSFPRYKPK